MLDTANEILIVFRKKQMTQSQPQQSGGGMAEKRGTENSPFASFYFFDFYFLVTLFRV